jgi:lysozyme
MKEWGEISHDRALDMLRTEADNAWRVIEEFVTVPINQNQADALISFAYNVGVGAFMSSTLLKRINAGGTEQAIRYEFSRWVKASGQTLPGLVRRREAEADLYFTP